MKGNPFVLAPDRAITLISPAGAGPLWPTNTVVDAEAAVGKGGRIAGGIDELAMPKGCFQVDHHSNAWIAETAVRTPGQCVDGEADQHPVGALDDDWRMNLAGDSPTAVDAGHECGELLILWMWWLAADPPTGRAASPWRHS